MTPITWESAARQVGLEILAQTGEYPEPLNFIDGWLTDMNQAGALVPVQQRAGFLAMAHCAILKYAESTGENAVMAMLHVCDTIALKQADYGPQNILWAGVPGIVLRMHDKTARIRNLYSRYWRAETPAEESAANEPLADSWLDIVGYSIVGIMLLDGLFELPLNRDLPEGTVEVGGQVFTESQWEAAREALTGTPGPVASVSYDAVADATGNVTPLHETPNPFWQAESDPDIKEAFRQFAASASMPEEVSRGGDDLYTIEGGGTINVYPAPDGSHTHVLFTDGEGGVCDIMAAGGVVGIDTDGTVFSLNSQRMAVILSMLLGAAEAGLDWRNTNVTAEVPREG